MTLCSNNTTGMKLLKNETFFFPLESFMLDIKISEMLNVTHYGRHQRYVETNSVVWKLKKTKNESVYGYRKQNL